VLEELLEEGEGLGGGEPAPHDEQGDRHTLKGGGEGAVEPRLAGEAAGHEHQPFDLLHAEQGELERRKTAGVRGDEDHAVEPDPLEEVLHPRRDVLAVRRQLWGEDAEASDELVEKLQAFAKERIAPYKYPREVEFVESLPKTATGKLRRSELRGG